MPTDPDPDLMRIFNFTAADLEANRNGKLSEHQIEKLTSRRKQGQWLAGMGCVILIAFAVLVGVSSAAKEGNSRFFLVLIIGAFPITFIYLGTMDRKTDLDKRNIKSNVTEIFIGQSRGKWGEMYYDISIYPLSYGISKAFYTDVQSYLRKLGAQTKFCVYYAPESRELLSIEVVEK